MKCSICGTSLQESFVFCPQCGAKIISDLTLNTGDAKKQDIKMIKVPGGTFYMGDKLQNRRVSVDIFAISQTPITQAQYFEVMGVNPSKLKGNNRPVESVNWCEAVIFCNMLSIKKNLTPCYSIGDATNLSGIDMKSPMWKHITCNFETTGYRLPTEAEWEFAARGGKNAETTVYAGGDDIDKVAWYGENSNASTHDVALKFPNTLELYDMSGNVAEWCWDYMDELEGKAISNPHGPSIGNMHIKRGGSWLDDAEQCTVLYRSASAPTGKASNLGFRICQSGVIF